MYVILNRRRCCFRDDVSKMFVTKKEKREDVFLRRVVSASLSSLLDLRDGMVGKRLER